MQDLVADVELQDPGKRRKVHSAVPCLLRVKSTGIVWHIAEKTAISYMVENKRLELPFDT